MCGYIKPVHYLFLFLNLLYVSDYYVRRCLFIYTHIDVDDVVVDGNGDIGCGCVVFDLIFCRYNIISVHNFNIIYDNETPN